MIYITAQLTLTLMAILWHRIAYGERTVHNTMIQSASAANSTRRVSVST